MSIIFGMRSAADRVVEERTLSDLAQRTERYGRDGTSVHTRGRVGMGAQIIHTTLRSSLESQPTVDDHGNMLVFDGRLDNYAELVSLLDLATDNTSDSQIVLASFLRWGEDCFRRFVGDWAVALWCESDGSLYLARDHAGTRTLFYEQRGDIFQWSTHLETFFGRVAARPADETYVAAYLSLAPIGDLTPYRDIRAVTPAHYLVVRDRRIILRPHWDWVAKGSIRYKSDDQYEEHFLTLFQDSVKRRTVEGASLLAQLSGGMDSSSIVCMSDHIRRSAKDGSPLVDTISYYDDSEPDWNERPFFSVVEAKRGKTGLHIDVTWKNPPLELNPIPGELGFLPGMDWFSLDNERTFERLLGDKGYRAILSGIGGDELTGGVPTPFPELADDLVRLRFGTMVQQATRWSVATRSLVARTLFETAQFTFDMYFGTPNASPEIPPWIEPKLRDALKGHLQEGILKMGRKDRSPSSISNGRTWWAILETLPSNLPGSLARYEYRYPFLDKDLVNFLLRVPREQLVRPGRRRYLMRRALESLVPAEVLERRRKAFLIRRPLKYLQFAYESSPSLYQNSRAAELGYIDVQKFRQSLEAAANGGEVRWWHALMKTIILELWLRADPVRAATAYRTPRETILLCR
jgi:asparagine synthase (glutamine-hydrolysing)